MSRSECEFCKKKHREEAERKALINRLSRIEGQVRGLKSMVEGDAYCPDILTQVSAAEAALAAFGKQILDTHIRTCVAEGIRRGDEGVIDELVLTIQKLTK